MLAHDASYAAKHALLRHLVARPEPRLSADKFSRELGNSLLLKGEEDQHRPLGGIG